MVSFWAWEKSSAHFNMAITVGEAMANMSRFRDEWIKYALIAFAQLTGSLTGVLMTFIASKKTDTNNTRTITPDVPVLCPGYSKQSCSTSSQI